MLADKYLNTKKSEAPKSLQAIINEIAFDEMVSSKILEKGLNNGSIVILHNKDHSKFLGVGHGLTTKVNANVGTSSECRDYKDAIKKAKIAIEAGAHTLMDLSTIGIDGQLDFGKGIAVLGEETGVPVGTVPIYEAARRGMDRLKSNKIDLDPHEMLDIVENQAKHGSTFMVAHAALNQQTLAEWRKNPRNIVSKGGYLTAEYMLTTGKENPFYEKFDILLDILKKYDVVLNIGSALRSGSTRFNDEAQLAELESAGELAKIANRKGVKVVIEGPGHVPYSMIAEIVAHQKRLTGKRPFFILGFVASDAFAGWDHIVSTVGAAEAVRHGVSWLCTVTRAEHQRMPNSNDINEGVFGARIAAHIGDCANQQPKALALETKHNEKGCLDPVAKRQYCSMCGKDFCPIKRLHDLNTL